jgi:hypothetical protein
MEPPAMFSRPADAPEPLTPLRSQDELVAIHVEWQRMHAQPDPALQPTGGRLRRKAKSLVNRAVGNADRELLGDLIRAIDTVAARCDELSERLSSQQIVVGDAARIFGEEITQLRAATAQIASAAAGHPATPPAP